MATLVVNSLSVKASHAQGRYVFVLLITTFLMVTTLLLLNYVYFCGLGSGKMQNFHVDG
jgi:riboflavin transporter FmnP